jgi:hypothetical protein
MRIIVATIAVLACMALAACGDTETPFVPPGQGPISFGINAQAVQPLASDDRADELNPNLDVIAELRFEFVRSNLDWRQIQPTAPAGAGAESFDWETTDTWVEALALRGLRWQPTAQAGSTPSWAADQQALSDRCAANSPPRSPSDYADLVAALAARYGTEGRFWEENPNLPYVPVTDFELTNEPNFDRFWCPRPDPRAWARLVLPAARAIHRADPRARVVSGGLAPFREQAARPPRTLAADRFLRRALRAEPGLAREIDVVGVHPYGGTPAAAAGTLAWFLRIVDATPLRGKPFSVNEFGWTTSGNEGPVVSSEDQRAEFVAEATPLLASPACRVVEIALHTWTSPETDPENPEDWYGVAHGMFGEPYPTALVYAAEATNLRDTLRAPARGSGCSPR